MSSVQRPAGSPTLDWPLGAVSRVLMSILRMLPVDIDAQATLKYEKRSSSGTQYILSLVLSPSRPIVIHSLQLDVSAAYDWLARTWRIDREVMELPLLLGTQPYVFRTPIKTLRLVEGAGLIAKIVIGTGQQTMRKDIRALVLQ